MNPRTLVEPLRDYLPHIGVLAAIVALGILLGIRGGPSTDAAKAGPDQWRLPSIPARVVAAPDNVAAIAAIFFEDNAGKPPPTSAPKVASQTWRFVGTARAGGNIMAVISAPKPLGVLRVAVGAKLPNGENVVAVENGVMRYTDENGEHEVRAFQKRRTSSKEDK